MNITNNRLDLIDIYRTLHPTISEHTVFFIATGTVTEREIQGQVSIGHTGAHFTKGRTVWGQAFFLFYEYNNFTAGQK